MTDAEVCTEVNVRLDAIERDQGVTVIYACESGSRAWGFASKNSDYDIRFIYVRSQDWYLSIDVETRRDVIEETPDVVWDVNGWDLRKALRLLRKSNPPLLEWFQSPIVYREVPQVVSRIRSFLPLYFSSSACMFHYLHMADGNYRKYIVNKRWTVQIKKYLYVLRPLLACRWIEQGRGVVPTRFNELLHGVVDEPMVVEMLGGLIDRKVGGDELDEGPKLPILDRFIEEELVRHERTGIVRSKPADVTESLNLLFRRSIDEAWVLHTMRQLRDQGFRT